MFFMFDVFCVDFVVGVVGFGIMGCGIVQVFVQGGVCMLLFDVQFGVVVKVCEVIVQLLKKFVECGKLDVVVVEVVVVCIEVVGLFQVFVFCYVVIEVIVEDLCVKCEFFVVFEVIVVEECIFVFNILLFFVMVMVVVCKCLQCVVGYYFFNLVLVMKIVEVVDGEFIVCEVIDVFVGLVWCFGYFLVCCKDMFGFVVNYVGCVFVFEVLCILGEGIVDFVIIDCILVDGVGFCLGLFGLMDFVGLDVLYVVMKLMYQQYFEEFKYWFLFFVELCVVVGLFGCKSGCGWYVYGKDGNVELFLECKLVVFFVGCVWVVFELCELIGVSIESDLGKVDVCLVVLFGKDVIVIVFEMCFDLVCIVVVDLLFGFLKCIIFMLILVIWFEVKVGVYVLFVLSGWVVLVINDLLGFVVQCVVVYIVNVGCDIVQMCIVQFEDFDWVVMLGLGYLCGLFVMGDVVGLQKIFVILQVMYNFYQEFCYCFSLWLMWWVKFGVFFFILE